MILTSEPRSLGRLTSLWVLHPQHNQHTAVARHPHCDWFHSSGKIWIHNKWPQFGFSGVVLLETGLRLNRPDWQSADPIPSSWFSTKASGFCLCFFRFPTWFTVSSWFNYIDGFRPLKWRTSEIHYSNGPTYNIIVYNITIIHWILAYPILRSSQMHQTPPAVLFGLRWWRHPLNSWISGQKSKKGQQEPLF